MYYFNFPQVSVFLATKVHICPTCKIHSPHPKFPPSLNLLQHQLKVQNLISSKGLNLIINSGMGEALGVIHSGAQFLSTCGPVKLKKQVTCFQNIMVGQA